MKDIILLGKQGSGKGTQSRILTQKYPFDIFETGSALREVAGSGTELGTRVKAIVERGDLVPNDIVMEIVRDFVSNVPAERAVLFDGIPRFEEQRQTMEALLSEMGRDFLVLEIRLSDEEARTRLGSRAQCGDCGFLFSGSEDVCPKCGSTNIIRRADDVPEAIEKRLQNFREKTEPLFPIWERQGRLLVVNGEQDVEAVTRDMEALLEAHGV